MSTSEQDIPYVVRGGRALANWSCHQWTRDQWDNNCGKVKFRFRVHERKSTPGATVEWENRAVDYIDATVSEIISHIASGGDKKSPFADYPAKNYSFYSAYNYLEKIPDIPMPLINAMKWNDLADQLGDRKIQTSAPNGTTFWIGTEGSYTPCHQDTYGYNYVVQLHGRKRWILFSPNNTSYLYPSRIPYEESSIFSELNVAGVIDLNRWPLAAQLRPYVVVMEPGDMLYVPHHWWHFVQNMDDLCISVNRWVEDPIHAHTDWLSECMVQMIFNLIFHTVSMDLIPNADEWFNVEAIRHIMPVPRLFEMISFLLKDEMSRRFHGYPPAIESGTQPQPKPEKPPAELAPEYLKPSPPAECLRLVQPSPRTDLSPSEMTPKNMVNCLLHPDVISLIVQKLKQH